MNLLRLATCLTAVFLPWEALAEQAPTRVIIVLDASGSMRGKIGGKKKIDIARDVIRGLMKDWDAKTPVGLVAYGHRKKGDCQDIQTLVDVRNGAAPAIVEAVQKLRPKGKTPLTDAVISAAREIGYDQQRAAVVLVSDGMETCGADPCAAGAKLAMSGVDFKTHVIGFDVKKTEQAGLKCLAKSTDGIFVEAQDAPSLEKALQKSVDKAKEAPAPIVPPGAATVAPPAAAPAGSEFEVPWTGPNSRRDYLTIVKVGAKEGSFLDFDYTRLGPPGTLRAPDEPGKYEVRYMYGRTRKTLAAAPIEITAVSATIEAPSTAGGGSEVLVHWVGPANKRDYLTIVAANSKKGTYKDYAYTTAGSPVRLTAPDEPGAYEIRYVLAQSTDTLASRPLKVTPVTAQVSAPASVKVGTKFSVTWTGPNNKKDFVTIVKAGAAKEKYGSYAYTKSGSPAKLKAPKEPGAYEVRYVMANSRTVLARVAVRVR